MPRATDSVVTSRNPATGALVSETPECTSARRTLVERGVAPVVSVESSTRTTTPGRIANDTPCGLAAAVYTSSAERVGAAQERLEVGIVGVTQRCDSAELEAPFGGAKSSGNGFSERGEYA